jgi:hypothetical protein
MFISKGFIMNRTVFCLLLLTSSFHALLNAQTMAPAMQTAAIPALPIQGSSAVAETFAVAGSSIRMSTGLMFFSMQPVKGAPYSADMMTSSIQTLADGNQIQHTTKSTVYRDSHGRIRTEQYLSEPLGQGMQAGGPPRLITIQDPDSGVSYVLDPIKRTAQRNPEQQIKKIAELSNTKMIPAETITMTARSMLSESEISSTKMDLGTQIMQGIPAKGTKTTTTFAAGSIGNTLPVEVTDESWYSADLHAIVMSKHSDPRTGVTTYQLTDINRTEPAASQFEIPSDYAVTESSGPGMITIRKTSPEDN